MKRKTLSESPVILVQTLNFSTSHISFCGDLGKFKNARLVQDIEGKVFMLIFNLEKDHCIMRMTGLKFSNSKLDKKTEHQIFYRK
jgi:hypothetical protein